MKKFLFIFGVMVFTVIFTSCEKYEIPSPYGQEPEVIPEDTTTWDDGGTITIGSDTLNDLIGTTWVLTKYVTGFSVEYPNDTLDFISNNEYTINGGTAKAYQLSNI
ncbi:MAG: hypothetical protein GTO02_04145, partial [Candidatus Dadabacteria bacterium]|nr:hypothetical protein [Candidatus Dadabacteria bacterium]